MYISVGSDVLGGTSLGMVWVWKGTGQDGVGERGHHLMEKMKTEPRALLAREFADHLIFHLLRVLCCSVPVVWFGAQWQMFSFWSYEDKG